MVFVILIFMPYLIIRVYNMKKTYSIFDKGIVEIVRNVFGLMSVALIMLGVVLSPTEALLLLFIYIDMIIEENKQ